MFMKVLYPAQCQRLSNTYACTSVSSRIVTRWSVYSSHGSSRRQLLLSLLPCTMIGCDESRAEVSTQEIYDHAASQYDQLDGGGVATALGFDDMRHELISQARGRVLEIGVGTGLNLPYYNFEAVGSLVGVDISPGMLQEAKRRSEGLGGSIELIQADATALPLEDASFDTVLDSFSLCTFNAPLSALREMRRVVRPGGRVLLLEHSRSDNGILASYQQLTAETVRRTARGCDWSQAR